MPTSRPFLVHVLRSLCEDALFLLASSMEVDEDHLQALAKRRGERYESLARGGQPDGSGWEKWVTTMAAAMAPIKPAAWLPMQELVSGLTLEGGARGVRSLFTSKPSEKEVLRTRKLGAMAVRCLTAAVASDGSPRPDEDLLRASLVASLGLPEEDERLLLAERSMPVESIEVVAELEPKQSKAIVRGAWLAVLSDGLDPREDAAVAALAQRLGVSAEDCEALRQETRTRVDSRKIVGAAAVDAVRYLLSDEPEVGPYLSRMVANLALPWVHRGEPLAMIENAGPVILAKRHSLERGGREACLALAWVAAMATDPSATRMAELLVRHDRVSTDLGSKSEAEVARSVVQPFLQGQLALAATAAGL